MTFIELIVPKGSLDDDLRRQLGHRIVTELIAADGAPSDLIERGRALTWLVVHEPEVWMVGGRAVAPNDPPRFVVRVTVPDGHLTDAMRAELVARITRVLAMTTSDHARLYGEPDAWVQIVEMADGSLGTFGRVVTSGDLIRLIVDAAHRDRLIGRSGGASNRETLIDPICSMSVALTDYAITLEHEGTTYGFCSAACREAFVARLES
ncbi:MAG TPA: hypothetical protein VFZ69_02280 [Longimicrobiales bacterium]